MRLSHRDTRALRELNQSLRVFDDEGAPAFEQLLPQVRELLGVELACAYGMERSTSGFRLTFCQGASHVPLSRLRAGTHAFVSAQKARWGLFDPIRPEPLQRNRVLCVPSPAEAEDLVERQRLVRRFGVRPTEAPLVSANLPTSLRDILSNIGFSGRRQLRVLVCDGGTLMAWFGVLDSEPFTDRQKQLLGGLVPGLAKRLRLERFLELGESDSFALAAALEQIPRAAFVVDARGSIRHGNAIGRALWDEDRRGLQEALSPSVRAAPEANVSFDLTRLESHGTPSFLAIQKSQSALNGPLWLERAARQWELTRRQTDVLALLGRGQANKSIAANLGCAVHTVELHVSAILDKAGVSSRAQLLALLLSQRD